MLEALPELLGQALRGTRAGLEKAAYQLIDLRTGTSALRLSSPAFVDHGPIPACYTADGAALSPPLEWTGVPREAGSLVLIVEDADAPTPRPLVHAIAVGLSACEQRLEVGALTGEAGTRAPLFRAGRNSCLGRSWLPPDPPPGHGPHRYVFQLFALAGSPRFSTAPGRGEVLDMLSEHALASGCLIGTYERDRSVRVGDADRASLSAAPVALGSLPVS